MELERAFADWLDRRDAAALARVFDGTAGRLLLLAVHFAGPGAEAEDLVQATFLQAMQGASWDRARPLWPWLAAILQNEARMAWRRRQRRREVGIEGADATAAREPDPAERALHSDACDAAVAAIDALPLPYRQVLRLRLQHGLSPIEIARALEVPVGTVRSQLHRGLEQLRGALPAGLAVAVAACLVGEGALLAQVRTQVLAHGKAMASGATAATGAAAAWWWFGTAGWWGMKGKLLAGAALAIILCGGLLLFGGGTAPAAGPGSALPAPALARGDARGEEPSAEPASQQRTAAVATAAPEWELVATVTGGGVPLAGAEVRVWVAARGGMEGQRSGEGLRETLAHGATGADGTFRCALDELRARSELVRASRLLFVTAREVGRGDDTEILALPAATAPHAFEARLQLGPRGGIVGRVVDAVGTPVAAAEVRTMRDGRMRDTETTADDGRFTVPARELDDWPEQLVVLEPAHGLVQVNVPTTKETLAPGTVVDVGDVMLSAGHAIRGRVVLGDGLPLAEYPVWLVAIDDATAAKGGSLERFVSEPDGNNRGPIELRDAVPGQAVVHARTAADGTFAFAGLERERPYAIAVRDSGMRFLWVAARAGAAAVELVVARQLMAIDVRDDAGSALQGMSLFAEARAGERMIVGNAPFAADDAGRHLLLSPFGWSWTISVSDAAAQADSLSHEVVADVHRADLALVLRPERRIGQLHLCVVDDVGVPLPKYGVYLRCLDRELQRNETWRVPPPDRFELPAGRWHVEVWLGKDVIYDGHLQMYARGRHDEDVVIADGATTELRVVAPPAGMVAFELHSDVLPPDDRWPELKIVDQTTGREVLVLSHPEFGPGFRPLTHPFEPMVGALLVARQAFAPGPRAFVLSARGYRSERCEVEVAADALTRCRLRLIRQP